MDNYKWGADDIFSSVDASDLLSTAKQIESPEIMTKRAAKRIMVNGLKKQALSDLIKELPSPDTDMYIIGNGAGAERKHGINPKAFDFGTFLSVVADMFGNGCIAHISTWTLNSNHAMNMVSMLESGKIKSLTFFADSSFQTREPAVSSILIAGILKRGKPSRYLSFKNHAKIIALSDANGEKFCTITGSANLSSQPRCEQYVLTTSPDVYHFFIHDFFEAMI